MSSAARFLLEFEATGDQEVVAKIKAVGEAGKQTATDLESLRGIEDPFEPIATGADAAVAPIEGVGTAAEGAVTPITEMGTATDETVSILEGAGTTADEFGGAMEGVGTAADTAVTPLEGVGTAAGESLSIFEGAGTATGDFSANLDAVGGAADAATGGLEPANTLMGDFGESASTSADKTGDFGGSLQSMSGSIVSVAGTVGGLVSMLFTYQDAQARVQKAQLAAARAAEIYRKAQEAVNTLLATATSNEDAIAAARERVATALAKVNELMMAGVTSGAEFAAAQQELADAQKALGVEAAKGGVNVAKLTSALEKEELAMGKTVVATKNLDKQNREAMTTMLGMVSQAAGIGGSFVQMAGSFGKVTMALRGLSGGLTAVTGVGLAGLTAALGIGAAAVGVFLGAVLALSKAPYDQILGKLDQLGKSIGTILPQAQGPLTAVGDAFRSSLNFLTKGTTDMIKALSGIDLESKIAGKSFSQLVEEFMKFGTVGNAEVNPALDAFIKKGREIGLTDKEIIELAKQHNAEFEKVANTTKLAGVAHGLFAGAVGEAAVSLEEMATQTEAQAAAAQKLVGPTVELNKTLAGTAETYAAITAEDVKYVAAKEAENRANIIASAGYNNANVAAIQYEQALTAMTQSMVEDTDQKNANAQATLALVDSELNAQNAIATVNEEYANSVDRLADLNTVLGNTEAKTKAVATVSNEFAASLKEQSIELEGTLQALQDVENQEQGVANAILQTKVSLEESNQALREAKAVRDDAAASADVLKTAVNENAVALIEEAAELEAAAASADSLEQSMMRLQNAFNAGVVEIKEWANGLAEAEANQRGQISALEAMGAKWSDIPPFVEKNIETLKLFGVAAKRGGEAAKEAADMAAEAWQDATSIMGSEVEDLSDIWFKGGEKMGEATDKWFADLERKLGRNLSDAEKKAAEGLRNVNVSALQAINNWKWGQTMGESIEKSGADAAAAFDAMGDQFGGKVGEVFHKAAEIIRRDPSLASAVNEIMANVGTTAPHLLLDQLNNILPPGMKAVGVTGANEMSNAVGAGLTGLPGQVGAIGEQAGTAFGTGFTGNAVFDANTMVNNMGLNELPPKAGTIGKESGITLEQEFAKQLESIVNTINTMQLKPIPITVDVQQAGAAIASIVKTLSTLQAAPIKVTADVSQAHQAIAGLVTKAQSLVVTVTADVSPAHQAIAALVTQKPEPIVVTANTAQAVSALNAASNAALTMRNNFNAASSGVKSAVAGAGSAVTSFSSKASSSFAKAGAAGTTMANKVKSASSSMKSSLSSAASSAASFASKCVSSFNKVGSSASSNASRVRSLASAINSLKSKTITITTRYVTSGRPTRGGLQHGGSFIADSPTTIGGTKIGEHYKPELVTVTPLTNPNNLDKTITVNTPGGRGGSSREVVIPVTLMLDNKVLIRTVRRGLVEEVSGTM